MSFIQTTSRYNRYMSLERITCSIINLQWLVLQLCARLQGIKRLVLRLEHLITYRTLKFRYDVQSKNSNLHLQFGTTTKNLIRTLSTHWQVFDEGYICDFVAPSIEFLCLFREVWFDEHGVSFRVEIFLPPYNVGTVGVGHAPVEVGRTLGEWTLSVKRRRVWLRIHIW